MDPQILIVAAVFGCVVALVGAVAVLLGSNSTSNAEERLQLLTTTVGGSSGRRGDRESVSLLAGPLDETISLAESLISRVGDLRSFLEQCGVRLKPARFVMICVGLGGLALTVCIVLRAPVWVAPEGVALGRRSTVCLRRAEA